MTKRRPKLYIFDADGTLRWTRVPGQFCPYRPDEWALMPNVSRVLRDITRHGSARLAIASNQDPVAWGCLSRTAARAMLRDTLIAAIGRVPRGTMIELCTRPSPQLCMQRKPWPGMLVRLLRHAGVSPHEALFVGDLQSDLKAARRAGIPFRWAWEFFGWGTPGEKARRKRSRRMKHFKRSKPAASL